MHYQFPGPFIFYKEIDNHQEIKKKYLPIILEDIKLNKHKYKRKDWNCDVYTSLGHKIDFLFDDMITDNVIWKPFDECISNVHLTKTPYESKICDLWYNYYTEGFFQECHVHEFSSFSGIYILSLDEVNTTSFYNKSQHYSSGTYTTKSMKEGTVIIFPSDLVHYVNPVKKDRTTISFNIQTTFTNL